MVLFASFMQPTWFQPFPYTDIWFPITSYSTYVSQRTPLTPGEFLITFLLAWVICLTHYFLSDKVFPCPIFEDFV